MHPASGLLHSSSNTSIQTRSPPGHSPIASSLSEIPLLSLLLTSTIPDTATDDTVTIRVITANRGPTT